MPCYSPLTAYQSFSGEIFFAEHKCRDQRRQLQLPCGQCHGCRLERSRQWAVRCLHEAQLHTENSFLTLTYAPEHLPKNGSLDFKHPQDFLKRLRYYYPRHKGYNLRYYGGGEYGEETFRPHYHICLFGKDWDDKTFYTKNAQGDTIWTSRRLDEIWGMGQWTTGEVNFRTAAYTARYIMQKRTGPNSKDHYKRYDTNGEPYWLEPEDNFMSLKPAIGAGFFHKYADDIYNHDYVIVNGKEQKPPKYYDHLLQRHHIWAWQDITETREWEAYQRRADNTPARLAVKERVSKAAIKMLKRNQL